MTIFRSGKVRATRSSNTGRVRAEDTSSVSSVKERTMNPV
jgi:hypothetical protein